MQTIQPLPAGNPWPRSYLLDILHTALTVKAYRFARQTALAWLTSYENDLYVRLLHTQAMLGEGPPLAQYTPPMIETICQADPEFLEAQILRVRIMDDRGAKGMDEARGCVEALGGRRFLDEKLARPTPAWTLPLSLARKTLAQGDFDTAHRQISLALTWEPIPPLVGVTHLRSLWAQGDTPKSAIRSIAEHYHARWPNCIPVMLILADSMMGGGMSDKAVALLHRAASSDPGGQAAGRIWGEENPYQALWPERMEAVIDIAVPADVAAALGWNLLPAPHPLPLYQWVSGISSPLPTLPEREAGGEGEIPAEAEISSKPSDPPRPPSEAPVVVEQILEPEPDPEPDHQPDIESELQQARSAVRDLLGKDRADEEGTPRPVEEELAQIARRLDASDVIRSDGRLPVYVVFSTRAGLNRQFGPKNSAALDDAMEKLVLTLRERPGWGSILVYADDAVGMAGLGLKPSPPDDPWKLKLALADLDSALKTKGAMIGALLIVGGPEVVPYHHLPNPTDDTDRDVPSDNPYATRDENYFIPEWPVGRLPGGAGRESSFLLTTLQEITRRHAAARAQHTGRMRAFLRFLLDRLLPHHRDPQSFGYSAEVWQRAAHSVFRAIGEPRHLITSPPLGEHNHIPEPAARLGYFNLHGLIDAAEWYGHRDPANYPKPGLKPVDEGPDYPIALRPQDVVDGGRAPQVVFSEACYGAHILDRPVEGSLALKFLQSGSQAVVGSTVIAYGSVTTPLNAADLLGKAFWQYLQGGFPAGEALRRAKIHLAREMHKRQGYLDGEDQKTLISFVLYGDPLANARNLSGFGNLKGSRKPSKEIQRYADSPPQVKTICDRAGESDSVQPIPDDVVRHVKRVVEQYLPGMEGAQLSLSYEHAECCCQGHTCPTGNLSGKFRPSTDPQRRVVTMSKETHDAYRVHPSYARLTLDRAGRIVKVAVSR
ncbi:MAG: hypothetical protein FJ010_09315 [Chloroflexi bacterium]|nr:hypothetical protein [Chloroflexota bacterium]